jgi:hypothetical protein
MLDQLHIRMVRDSASHGAHPQEKLETDCL